MKSSFDKTLFVRIRPEAEAIDEASGTLASRFSIKYWTALSDPDAIGPYDRVPDVDGHARKRNGGKP